MNILKMINLDITYKCNLACRHCGALINNKQQEELSHERVISLLEEAVQLGCRDITIAGGEPFLRDDLFTILREATKRKIYVNILTNGTLIDKKTAQTLGKTKPYLSYPNFRIFTTSIQQYQGFAGSLRHYESLGDRVLIGFMISESMPSRL